MKQFYISIGAYPEGSYARWSTIHYQRFLIQADPKDPMLPFARQRVEALKPRFVVEPVIPEPDYPYMRDEESDRLAVGKDPIAQIAQREAHFASAAIHAINKEGEGSPDLKLIAQIYQLRRQRKHDEVNQITEAFLEEYPQHELVIPVTFVLANSYTELGKLSEALGVYEQLIHRYPDDLGVQYQAKQAMASIKQQQAKGAEELALRKELVEQFPQIIGLRLDLAYAYLRLKHFQEAEHLYTQLLSEVGEKDAQQAAELHMRLGEVYFNDTVKSSS